MVDGVQHSLSRSYCRLSMQPTSRPRWLSPALRRSRTIPPLMITLTIIIRFTTVDVTSAAYYGKGGGTKYGRGRRQGGNTTSPSAL